MIAINLESLGEESIYIPNNELIKSILAMPDDEYTEILSGILTKDRLNTEVLLRMFAICYHQLYNQQLNPAQFNAFNKFIFTIYERQSNKNYSTNSETK